MWRMSLVLASETCGTFHNITTLSVFSASSSFLLAVLTTIVNITILYSIALARNDSKIKYKLLFYKLLLNIALADLLKGIVAGTSSVVFHVKESLGYIEDIALDAPIVHLSLLITDSSALVSVTILSVDRIVALFFPIKYRVGISKRKENFVLLLIWPFAIAIVTPYFQFNYIKELAIFSGITISVTVGSLFMLTLSFKKKFHLKKRESFNISTSNLQNEPSCSNDITLSGSFINMTYLNNVENTSDEFAKLKGHGDEIDKVKKHGDEFNKVNNHSDDFKSDSEQREIVHNLSAISISSMSTNSLTAMLQQNLQTFQSVDNLKNIQATKERIRTYSEDFQLQGTKDMRTFQHLNILHTNKSKFSTTVTQNNNLRETGVLTAERTKSTLSLTSTKSRSRQEKKVTRVFIKMLIVFIATYLPIVVIVAYMNFSDYSHVHCVVRHVLRDFTVLFILASSLFRGLNFILTLKHLRRSVKTILRCN